MIKESSNNAILLLYYSLAARERLEAELLGRDLEIYSIDGRTPDASERVRNHPARVVIIDHGANDVSITQAIRQVGQILPHSLVVTVYLDRQSVEMYRNGHRLAWALC